MKNYYHEALRYYEPLQQLSEYEDVSYLLEMANCYREVGLTAEAENCYSTIIDIDHGNLEARVQLKGMSRGLTAPRHGFLELDEAVTVSQHKARRPTGTREAKRSKKATVSLPWSKTMLVPGPERQLAKQQKKRAQEEDIQVLFQRREKLMEQARQGDESFKTQYMAILKSLYEAFRDNKVFYPLDKHHRFYGYSKEARLLAMKPKHELDGLITRSKWLYGKTLVQNEAPSVKC